MARKIYSTLTYSSVAAAYCAISALTATATARNVSALFEGLELGNTFALPAIIAAFLVVITAGAALLVLPLAQRRPETAIIPAAHPPTGATFRHLCCAAAYAVVVTTTVSLAILVTEQAFEASQAAIIAAPGAVLALWVIGAGAIIARRRAKRSQRAR